MKSIAVTFVAILMFFTVLSFDVSAEEATDAAADQDDIGTRAVEKRFSDQLAASDC